MKEHCLITGGAGFIGINLADHLLRHGKRVTVFDNFSRPGAEDNVLWLLREHGDGRLTIIRGDVRHNDPALAAAIEQVQVVFHLAGQVAVTTSVTHPREDFEVNAFGTLQVLEAIRASSSRPALLYSSTNKVYGKLADIGVAETEGRYVQCDFPNGISESRPLEFYSPYGCSKGSGDQYVLDYARIYGLDTIVFRQSCIYGPHQFGIEDQGWLAWFAIRALADLPVTIFGDGKQVRDVLFVDDLVAAYEAAVEHLPLTRGQAYNIGGGPVNTLSLLELVELLEDRFERRMRLSFEDWRPGDQLVFVSNIDKAKRDFDWEPRIGPKQGLSQLLDWLEKSKDVFDAREPAAHAVNGNGHLILAIGGVA